MSPIEQSTVRNRLLMLLPPADFERLAPCLDPVDLTIRQCLHFPDEPIEAAYFVESGMGSLLVRLEGGGAQEVGVVGREGVIGLPVVMGADSAPTEAMVQMSGTALRIRPPALRQIFNDSEAIRTVLLRYMLVFHIQVSQTAACNGHHRLEQRLGRWLLMAHDRAGTDHFPMTHEFLSMMLGVRRAGVTAAAGALHKAGLIDYGNGQVTILDRRGLEATSCECYAIVRREFDHLFGVAAGE